MDVVAPPAGDAASPQVSTPEREGYRRADIQGLRALAVILVIAEHAKLPLSGGFIGVDVFFVISGFVITGLILREITSKGTFNFKRFFLRRGFRLLPALAVMTTASGLAAMLLLSPLGTQQQAAATGGAASFWTSNVALYFITSSYFSEHVETNPFLHTWSLGVEEQFYILFPILLVLGWIAARKLRRSPLRGIIAVIVMTTVLSFALSFAASFGFLDGTLPKANNFAFYLSPARAWEFGVGALIATIAPAIARHKVLLRACALIGLAAVVLAASLISDAAIFPGWVAAVPVLGTALVILGGFTERSVVTILLSTRVLVYLGDISYSWYLWHWPFIVFFRRIWPNSAWSIFIAVLLSLVVASLSYHLIEMRFRKKTPALEWRSVRVLIAAILVPATVCGVMLVGSLAQWNDPQVKGASAQLLERPERQGQCLSDVLISQRDISLCTWGGERPGRPIYLFGDSNAQQLTEAVVGAGAALDRPVIVAAMGGCAVSIVDVRLEADPSAQRLCRNFVSDLLAWIGSQRAGTVLIAAAGEGITDPTVAYQLSGEQWSTTPEAKSKAWTTGMIRGITALQSERQDVVVVHVAPHFPGRTRQWWHPVECPNAVLFSNPSACGASLSLSEVASTQARQFDAEKTASAQTGSQAIDLRPALCPDGLCSTYRDGTWVYRDGLHISPEESRRLAGFFTAELS